jgi:hypothetical protein
MLVKILCRAAHLIQRGRSPRGGKPCPHCPCRRGGPAPVVTSIDPPRTRRISPQPFLIDRDDLGAPAAVVSCHIRFAV